MPADLGRDGAPLQAVEPAVGPPGQRVGHRVGVLHAEAGQEHLGIAVGPIVAVAVGVEQQVGRLEDEDAAVAEGQAAGQVQPGHEVVGSIGPAVAVGVLEDRDPIGALGPARRRLGDAVVGGPRVAIDRDPLQPGGVGILQILDDPEPAPVVELDRHRLADQRLGRDEADFQAVGDGHPPGRLLGGIALGVDRRRREGERSHPVNKRKHKESRRLVILLIIDKIVASISIFRQGGATAEHFMSVRAESSSTASPPRISIHEMALCGTIGTVLEGPSSPIARVRARIAVFSKLGRYAFSAVPV